MKTITPTDLIRHITDLAGRESRILVAIAGSPASGKSTFAAKLAHRIGASAAVLPMDGFHLDNDRLRQIGLLHRKGAPETFDADGFVELVGKLRNDTNVPFPTFDREADKTVPNAGKIGAGKKIVLIEGNYLLLNLPPWNELKDQFDLTVGLDVACDELERRLISRWIDQGLSSDEARARARGNDMKNVEIVQENSIASDFVVSA